jgi:dethiobiotin synthetase
MIRPLPVVVLVLGTGTDVGKTHVSCALLAAARRSPQPALRGFKPLLSGVSPAVAARLGSASLDYTDADSEPTDACDAERHGFAQGARPTPPLHVFEPPLSPHLAARQAGKQLDFLGLAEACVVEAERLDAGVALLVETAGGVFSPCTETTTYADLAATLATQFADRVSLRLLLVAPDRLGVIHDLRATRIALTAVGVTRPLVVVLSAPTAPDASTQTNQAELERLEIARISATFPHAHPDDERSREAAAKALTALF